MIYVNLAVAIFCFLIAGFSFNSYTQTQKLHELGLTFANFTLGFLNLACVITPLS